MSDKTVFSAESVCDGNPHKVADLLADSVLDAILEKDRFARVSCKVLVSTGLVMVAGELTTDAWVDIGTVVRDQLRELGYNEPRLGFDADSCAVMNILREQSEEIGLAVDRRGAGDQCAAVGYATNEGDGLPGGCQLMPVPIFLAHQMARRLSRLRKDGSLPQLRPDGKVGVCLDYEDGRPTRICAAVLSAQHKEEADLDKLRDALRQLVVDPILGASGLLDDDSQILINPAGPFTRGGPHVDAGFNGRKTSVDAYGSVARQMDAGFSGKDPTKPGRSGAYMARHVAKNLVAAGLADRCELRLAYAIGREEPIAVGLDTFGSGKKSQAELLGLIEERFDLSIPGIAEAFDLRKPQYAPLACFGHFGRTDLDLPWESAAPSADLR